MQWIFPLDPDDECRDADKIVSQLTKIIFSMKIILSGFNCRRSIPASWLKTSVTRPMKNALKRCFYCNAFRVHFSLCQLLRVTDDSISITIFIVVIWYDNRSHQTHRAIHAYCMDWVQGNCFFPTCSSILVLFCFKFLKKVGERPVTFLNWLDKWATLL